MIKVICTSLSILFFTNYSHGLELNANSAIKGDEINKKCKITGLIKRTESEIRQAISSTNESMLVTPEEISNFKEIQAFDVNSDGYCELIIGTGQGDVNEEYALFTNSAGMLKRSSVKSIYNPNFKEGYIYSKYREDATTKSIAIRFSAKKNDFYVSQEEIELDNSLKKITQLSDTGSKLKNEILDINGSPASLTIASEKSYFGDLTAEFEFKERKSYLVKGDKVTIIDFAENNGAGWYKILYKGKKMEIIGWMKKESFTPSRGA